MVTDIRDPAARSKISSKPVWHGTGLPSRPESCYTIRRRRVQKGGFQGLYSGINIQPNLLKPHFRFVALRIWRTQRECASVSGEENNPALAQVHSWGVINELNFTPLHTNSMVLTKKFKYNESVIHMSHLQVFRSSLKVLTSSKAHHPLAHEATFLLSLWKAHSVLGAYFRLTHIAIAGRKLARLRIYEAMRRRASR
ncbi:hypothetical protein EVAR_60348_1 [Eumeta japonica]|uniref:Uncharacterized protein n=1 Tax=Eumeta variegata TaxID=151549 RepID=A0A4C1ZPN9_EUMVA|nr:hypothetical protein EVAR_60348_1 [Eumeta japonica]